MAFCLLVHTYASLKIENLHRYRFHTTVACQYQHDVYVKKMTACKRHHSESHQDDGSQCHRCRYWQPTLKSGLATGRNHTLYQTCRGVRQHSTHGNKLIYSPGHVNCQQCFRLLHALKKNAFLRKAPCALALPSIRQRVPAPHRCSSACLLQALL